MVARASGKFFTARRCFNPRGPILSGRALAKSLLPEPKTSLKCYIAALVLVTNQKIRGKKITFSNSLSREPLEAHHSPRGHFEGWVFVVLAHAFLALLESRRSLSVEPRRWFSIYLKRTLIQSDGVEIYGLTVRRPRKSAIAPRPLRMQKIQTECSGTIYEERGGFASLSFLVFEVVWSQCACSVTLRQSLVARRY